MPLRSTRLRTLASFAVATAGVAALAACADDGPEEATTSTAPTSAGADLYAANCASCHGADLRGTDDGPSHLSQVYAPDHHSDDSFRAAVANGSPAHHWNFGDMAPVPGLDDEQVDAIIAFVREQQERHGLEAYPPE
jgi:mono/diheme cytochrome c family protein